jgi:hypothetical protein
MDYAYEHEHEYGGPSERRRHPRTEVLAGLKVTVLTAAMAARVQEISEGGFALETSHLIPKGVHRFRFEFEGVAPVEASAEAVHTTRLSLPGIQAMYMAGFEFLPSDRGTSAALAGLVKRIAAVCPP